MLEREHDVLIEHGDAEPAEQTAGSAGVSHSIHGPPTSPKCSRCSIAVPVRTIRTGRRIRTTRRAGSISSSAERKHPPWRGRAMLDTAPLDSSQHVALAGSAHRRQPATAPRFGLPRERLQPEKRSERRPEERRPSRSAGTLHSPIKGVRLDPELWSSRGRDG